MKRVAVAWRGGGIVEIQLGRSDECTGAELGEGVLFEGSSGHFGWKMTEGSFLKGAEERLWR